MLSNYIGIQVHRKKTKISNLLYYGFLQSNSLKTLLTLGLCVNSDKLNVPIHAQLS